MNTIGDRLKYLRERENLKQVELAKIFSQKNFNITSAAISQYESNKRKPDTDILAMYADYFDVSIDWLYYGEEKKAKDTYTGEELLKIVPEEYREAFKKLNVKQMKFVKKMAEEDIDPDVLLKAMEFIKEVERKYKNNK